MSEQTTNQQSAMLDDFEEGDISPEDLQSIEDMDAFYERSLSNFKEGEVVQGKVVNVNNDFVLVDIGYKSEGIVPADEFYSTDELSPGDEFDFFIEEPEDEDGMPILSKIKADKIKNWAKIQEVYENDGIIEGRIVRRVKGGLKVDIVSTRSCQRAN